MRINILLTTPKNISLKP